MDWNGIRQGIINEGALQEPWATVYARALGRCTYCDHDLLVHRLGYGSAEKDHLLPIVGEGRGYINLVLACRGCNLVKGDHNVLLEDEDPWDMLENSRLELITRAREYVDQRYQAEYGAAWEATKRVILGAVRAWGDQPAEH